MVRNLVLFSVDRVINRHQGEQTMFLDILSWNGHFLGTFLVVLLPKNFHFSFTSHLIGFADLPIITTKKREILTDTRKRASREKAPVNVRSTSECDTSECVEHKWMCEAHVNVRSTSHCLFFGHPPACKPQQLQQVGVYYIFSVCQRTEIMRQGTLASREKARKSNFTPEK